MPTPFKFSIDGAVSVRGLPITINGQSMSLLEDEIEYLLDGVDGQATACEDTPPPEVGFMLRGKLYISSNDEWALFVELLNHAAP